MGGIAAVLVYRQMKGPGPAAATGASVSASPTADTIRVEPPSPGALRDIRHPTRVIASIATVAEQPGSSAPLTPAIAEIASQPGLLPSDGTAPDGGAGFEPVRAMAPVPQLTDALDAGVKLPLATVSEGKKKAGPRYGPTSARPKQ
jgi:hypothetical protein